MTNITQRLRSAVQTLRRTPMPIADIAPMLQEAADTIDAADREVERFKVACNKFSEDEMLLTLKAENAALRTHIKNLLYDLHISGTTGTDIDAARAALEKL
jgi:IS30 family transposase